MKGAGLRSRPLLLISHFIERINILCPDFFPGFGPVYFSPKILADTIRARFFISFLRCLFFIVLLNPFLAQL